MTGSGLPCRIGDFSYLHYHAHPNSLVPQYVTMHEPKPWIIQWYIQDHIASGGHVYCVPQEGRLSIHGDFFVEWV